jgi:ComF family protein
MALMVNSIVNNRWNALRTWWWPGHCLLCRTHTYAGRELCDGCHADLPWIRVACPRCAAPLAAASAGRACGKCQRKAPPFDRARAALQYQAPVDRMILNLKYHRRLELARTLGELLATHIDNAGESPDVIVPVPLHPTRARERGYNQSLEIARVIAQRLRLPLVASAARRVRATAAQTALPLKQRARNVRNAFVVDADLKGKHVAVVDDVMTSGHTVSALAKALRRAGAKEISIWVVARA